MMPLFSLLATVVMSSLVGGSPVPRAWISTGPIALGDARASVERSLGGPGADCRRSPSAIETHACYTDGAAFLDVDYVEDRVKAIEVMQKSPPHSVPRNRTSNGVAFARWTTDGRRESDAGAFAPHAGWRVTRGPGGAYDDAFRGYAIAHGSDATRGWFTSIYGL